LCEEGVRHRKKRIIPPLVTHPQVKKVFEEVRVKAAARASVKAAARSKKERLH
jgi:hypothetical protein